MLLEEIAARARLHCITAPVTLGTGQVDGCFAPIMFQEFGEPSRSFDHQVRAKRFRHPHDTGVSGLFDVHRPVRRQAETGALLKLIDDHATSGQTLAEIDVESHRLARS
ncbi:MAG TPA: hypothetical protein DCX75_15075 [Brevundimonas sp.]|nr:hypothetical protein [Brevundimonas sp.]HAJ04361.1 hypothetical protein [Brevundimonas sp.]HAV51310.1 hypothetical protein [Brevundimonas sp.]